MAVAEGQTTKETAASLGILKQAVQAHLTKMFELLDVPNRAALVARAIEAGFIRR